MSLNARLNRLTIDLHNATKSPDHNNSNTKATPIADSWDDEASSTSDTEDPALLFPSSNPPEAPGPTIKSPQTRALDAERELRGDAPDMLIPPPTPISPQTGSKLDWSPASALGGGRPTFTPPSSASARSTPTSSATPNRYPSPNPPLHSTSRDDKRRPEKTTATANRLIAGALGIKAPPKTEEQRRYDRAVKEQEIKRRNREKEERRREEEEDERVKAAVWDE